MSFWEDSSPLVKISLIVGILGILYFGAAFAIGWPPFPPSCSHDVDGSSVSGCEEGANCVDGECVQQSRGL